MPRSLKKGPWVDEKLIEKIKKMKAGERTMIKTWSRDCTITPEMVGHKLGEFSSTKKFIRHGGKMQKEIEKGTETVAPTVAPSKPENKAK